VIDLGLSKLAVIGGIALVVIGPERLPAVARVAGRLFGKAQGYLATLKTEVNAQMFAETLKAEKDAVIESAEVLRSVADDMAEAEQDFSAAVAAANRTFDSISGHESFVGDDSIRQKQRSFKQKKRHYFSGPPVWYQRTQVRHARRLSTATRRRSDAGSVLSGSRFFG